MGVLGVPAAALWSLLILILAIAQLPPILVLGPVAIYAFSAYEATPAIIFLIWAVLVSACDGVLKPMLMARGLETPMIVILLGAIGGMMLSGIIVTEHMIQRRKSPRRWLCFSPAGSQ